MKKFLSLSVFLFTVFFSYTVLAQGIRSTRGGYEFSFPEKVQKLLADPLPAGTYSVGTTGDFPTIDSAFNRLSIDGISGPVTLELIDTLYTAPTTNTGFLLNGPIPGTGPDDRVTIKPATDKNVLLQGNGGYIVTFLNTSFLDFDGVSTESGTSLTMYSQYNTDFNRNRAVNFNGNCDHNIIQNLTCIGEDIYRYGDLIVLGSTNSSFAPDSNLIQNNFIKQGGGSIVVAGNSSGRRAIGNIVRNNQIGSETDSLISWGIHLEWCQNTLVENNIVQNLKVTTTYGGDILIPGINCYGGSGDTIRNNIVHNLSSDAGYTCTGILLSGGTSSIGYNNLVYNNMVYDIQSTSASASRVTGIQMWAQNNPKIYYNSVYLSGTGQNKSGSAALYIAFSCSNVEAKNNVLVNTRDESQYCASSIYSYNYAILTSDNNDLYYVQNQYNYLVKVSYLNYLTLSDWQATGRDLNSISEMPNFIGEEDLHIDEIIPTNLEKRAVPIAGLDTDFDGDARNADLPDIGADEFSGEVVPGPLLSGYSVGTKGYFPTIDSAFNRLSIDGISGPVTLELIDTLYTAPTNQRGFLLNGPIPGAGPDNRVTIKPAADKNVILQGNGRYIVTFLNTSFLNFDGVSTDGGTTLTMYSQYNTQFDVNRAVNFNGNSDHNIIQNLTCIGENIYGFGDLIVVNGTTSSTPDSNLIQNNFIKQGGGSIVVGGQSSLLRPTGNIIRNNKIGSETDSLISWGIHIQLCMNTIVENNIVQNLKVVTNTDLLLLPGIVCYGGYGDIIRNNVVHNIKSDAGYTSGGILLWAGNTAGNSNLVYNNMVYDIQSTSATANNRVTGIQLWGQRNPKIYHNSVYLSGTGQNKYGSAALYIAYSCLNVEVRNNVLVNTRDESPYYAASIYDYTMANLITSDNNDLFSTTGQNNCLVKIGNDTYNTLADWQFMGKDSNSVSEMPNFIDPYLHIDEGIETYLESGAVPIEGIDTDFDGDSRNADLPDIGADEFDGIPIVGVSDENEMIPTEFSLYQNYPNPFNPSTTIGYQLAEGSKVILKVFDILGRKVATVIDEYKPVGRYEVELNATNLPSGVYFYQLKAGDFVKTRKMMVIK